MKYVCFIGRWVTFHNGHKWLIEEGTNSFRFPALIFIRNTNEDPNAINRMLIIENWLKKRCEDSKIIIIPDIKKVCYGRGVGYDIEELVPPDNIKEISGTKIRNGVISK